MGAVLLLCAAGVAGAAQRIVTLAPNLADLVCAVEACDLLVGVAEYTDAPGLAPDVPRIGNAFNLNLEAVVALRPDLVLSWDGGGATQTAPQLRRLGIRVEPVAVQTLDDVAPALRHIGQLTAHGEVAALAAQVYARRLAALRRQYRDRPPLRAFYFTDTDPPYSVNRHSPIHAALSLCGAENVFADLPTLAAPVTLEAVVTAAPAVAIFAQQEAESGLARLWRRLPGLAITQPSRQVRVDANALTRASPRVLDGVEALCAGLDRVRAAMSTRGS